MEVFLAPPPVLVVVVDVVEDNLSPLPLLSSPLLLLFLFSLLLRSTLDTSFSSLPLSFSDEPGDLDNQTTYVLLQILSPYGGCVVSVIFDCFV